MSASNSRRQKNESDLINELLAMHVIRDENLCPKVQLSSFNEVASLLLVHGIVVRN